MQDLLELTWESFNKTQEVNFTFVTKAQFFDSIKDHTLETINHPDGTPAVIFIIKSASFHFIKLDNKFQASRAVLRLYPGSLIKQFGYAETSTPINDARQHRFNKLIGFIETHRDSNYVFYRIEKLKF